MTLVINELTRDIIRAMKFPTDEDKAFRLPSDLRIAEKLGTSFFIVRNSLEPLRRMGFGLTVVPNYTYIGLKKVKLHFEADYQTIKSMTKQIRDELPYYIDELSILSSDPLGRNVGGIGIVYTDEDDLNKILENLMINYPKLNFLGQRDYFQFNINLDPDDKKIIDNLLIPSSIERIILREVYRNPFKHIKDMSRSVFSRYTSDTYRRIKRILDAFTRAKAFFLEPYFPTTNLQGSTIFVVVLDKKFIKGNDEKEKLNQMKRILGKNYLFYREYYSNSLSFLCYYNNRKELIELKTRMVDEGYDKAMIFEDFQPIVLNPRIV
jgi:hypothetical protein